MVYILTKLKEFLYVVEDSVGTLSAFVTIFYPE